MDGARFLTDFFHYPDKLNKSREYAELRQSTTVKFGFLMSFILIGVIVFIPLHNFLLSKGFWVLNKVHILRSLNLALDRVLRGTGYSENTRPTTVQRLVLVSNVIVKSIAYAIYLNADALFQICLWLALFTAMTLIDINGGDLIFVAKRMGRLCAVSLPTVFLLTLRPSPLPQTLYLALLPIHKWLSRLVVLLAVLHTIVYCGYFHVNNTWEKAWKLENLYGWLAVLGFVLIVITSLLKVRDRTYKTFYFNHYFWSWVTVIALPFHIRPVNTSIANALNIAILSYQIVSRLGLAKLSGTADFHVIDVSPNLACVQFPNHLIANKAINPGAHVRITNLHPNILVRFFKQLIPNYHPYTLASLPLDRQQRLIVRKSSFKWDSHRRYIVVGTYDPKFLLIKSANTADKNFSISKLSVNARKILIVIGGSAISFAIPILRVANYHGIPVKVIWVLRDFRDVSVLRYFEGYIHGSDFEIFVTGSPLMGEYEASEPSGLKNMTSYGSILGAFRRESFDFEANEHSRLNLSDESQVGNEEHEDIDVDLIEEELDAECQQDCVQASPEGITPNEANVLAESESDEESHFLLDDSLSTTSRKTNRSHSTNEPFVPNLETDNKSHNDYLRTVKRLQLERHIYRGRPLLNYRYYNWCVSEGDIFTQCSGPVMDMANNFVCCRDLPGRQHSIAGSKTLPDVQKVWVISAGPKSLVKNTKLWANENGLKYHEEAFYV